MKNKICLIYNFGQHYREPIFRKMDKELNVDFYFGDYPEGVKAFDYNTLNGHKGILKYLKIYKALH